MYELIILSLLMRQPAHGYLIGKVLNNIIGPIAKASNGRIYPLLSKLEQEGLITVSDEEQDGRQVRTFRITLNGRERFRAAMLDTVSNPKEYQELFSFKATVFPLISPEERLDLIDHYIHHCRAHVMHLNEGCSDIEHQNEHQEATNALLSVMHHRIRQWELEITWAQSLRQQAAQTRPA